MPPHAVPPHADKNTPQTTHQRANIKYHERRQPDARTKRHDDVNLLEDVRPRRLPVRRHAPIRRKRHNLARQILPRFPIRHTLNHRKPARPHPTTSMPWAGLDEDVSRRETTMRVDASERFHANPHQDIRPPAPHRGRQDDGTMGRWDDGTTPSTQTQTQTHTTASSHHHARFANPVRIPDFTVLPQPRVHLGERRYALQLFPLLRMPSDPVLNVLMLR